MDVSGKLIVELRKELSLTQQEFAEKINYSRTYLSDIEVGKVKPSRRFLETITKKFGVSLDSLAVDAYEDWINYIITCTDGDYFIFIYGFTETELQKGEAELMPYLRRMEDYVIVDAKGMESASSLISAIMQQRGAKCLDEKQYELFCQEQERRFIVIKNLSISRIPKKGHFLKQLIQRSAPQTIIVLDKPSFLEKFSDELYSYAKITPAR